MTQSAAVFARRLASALRRRMSRSAPRGLNGPPPFEPGGGHGRTFKTRDVIASAYLVGDGIEIGAASQPLHVGPRARVRYVDRLSTDDLRKAYPELARAPLVTVDIVDDGETLSTVAAASQDFVVANHFIEHCENPILAFQNLVRVLKPDGRLFAAIPDKRYTFDVDRPCTPLDHFVRDFIEGPDWSRIAHVEEWCWLVNKRDSAEVVEQEVRHLINIGYRIHYHVWDADALMAFLGLLRGYMNFELELFMRNGFENILIVKKIADA